MARIAPTVCKLVQGTQLSSPVITFRMGHSPSLDFVHEEHTLCTVVGRLFFHLLEPSQHGFVGFVASGVKTLPQRVVRHAALVGLLQLQRVLSGEFTAEQVIDDNGTRIAQFLKVYLFHPSTDVYTCPLAMTDGAARCLLESGNHELIDRALPHLTSRDPATFWTSGQWMTETTGGSDVGRSQTRAVEENGAPAAS